MRKIKSDRMGYIQIIDSEMAAFIPKKLYPDGIKIFIDNEIIKLLSEAERALGELKGITQLLPDPDLFIAFYVKKEALLSSQIEGTQCSLDEVLQTDKKHNTLMAVDEVVNYIKAMNYGLEQLKKFPLSLRLINLIHEKLLADVRGQEKTPGEYKRAQNWLGPPGANIKEATFVPPPPNLMIELMGDLEKFYHTESELPDLIVASIFHLYFETIHPYSDGNGRVGRLLITYILCEKKILNKPLLYLSLFFKENKAQYYELLMDARFDGKIEDWIKFFLRGIRNTSIEAASTAKEILELQNKHRSKINSELSQYKLAFPCYELLCKMPIITITKTLEFIDASYPTVKSIFDKFIEFGILDFYDNKVRNKAYYYKNYLDILKRGT